MITVLSIHTVSGKGVSVSSTEVLCTNIQTIMPVLRQDFLRRFGQYSQVLRSGYRLLQSSWGKRWENKMNAKVAHNYSSRMDFLLYPEREFDVWWWCPWHAAETEEITFITSRHEASVGHTDLDNASHRFSSDYCSNSCYFL